MHESPFGIRENQRVALFIDGQSFYTTTKNLGWDVDYKKFRKHFDDHAELHRAMYFSAVPEGGEDAEYSPVIKLVDWLTYNRFRTITKPTRQYSNADGAIREKGTVNVEMATEMLKSIPFVDHMILFSGAGDLSYAVEAVQNAGSQVTVVSSMKTAQSSVSNELRRQADNFIDLGDEHVKNVMVKVRDPEVAQVWTRSVR